MRIAIVGGRDFNDFGLLCEKMDVLTSKLAAQGELITVLCGCAKGADALGALWAISRGHKVEYYPADWRTHGRAAGPIRNREMIVNHKADRLVAFWDGRSRGTQHAISLMAEDKRRIIIYRHDDTMQLPYTVDQRISEGWRYTFGHISITGTAEGLTEFIRNCIQLFCNEPGVWTHTHDFQLESVEYNSEIATCWRYLVVTDLDMYSDD